MTNNWKEFKNYCIEKFWRVGNFALITTGKSQTFNGFQHLEDNDANRRVIAKLLKQAKITPFSQDLIWLSDKERGEIKKRMDELVSAERVKQRNNDPKKYEDSPKFKTINMLRKIDIDPSIYSGFIKGHRRKKCEQYYKLVKGLGL